ATANTVKLQVSFSTTSPITNADIKPVPGWTAQEAMMTLPKPVSMDNETVTTAVKSITWTAAAGGGIVPGQFQEFAISVEGLPDNTNELLMPAVQTYSNGDVVNWNQPTVAGQPEPDHPTPSLALANPSGADGAAAVANTTSAKPSTSDGTARWLGGVGLVVAALALGFGIGAFVRGRRGGLSTGQRSKQEASV
ncbi:MAG TPA: YcnI family protein, partial [Pseudonocardiaceae bacterium]|nr:YcnI family protein [Pseudonocardiaceae bacterium]